MKIKIVFHYSSLLLFFLSCRSYNRFSLGQSNMDSIEVKLNLNLNLNLNREYIDAVVNQPPREVASSTQSSPQHINKFIDDFSDNIIEHVSKLTKINENENDIVSQGIRVVCQLYDKFSTDHENFYFIQSSFSQSDTNRYANMGKTFFKIESVHPSFMPKFIYLSSHITRNKTLKDNCQQGYSHARIANKDTLNHLIASIRRQIMLEVTYLLNQYYIYPMHQLGRYSDLKLCHAILLKTRKLVEEIINFRFENNETHQEKTTKMFKRSMRRYPPVSPGEVPNETFICQCLKDYFDKLQRYYYNPIEQKGNRLIDFVLKNINSLSANEANGVLLQNSVNRLVHTLCICNGVKLLLHFCLSQNSMTLPLNTSESFNEDQIKCTADHIRYVTRIIDDSITSINLAIENSNFTTLCTKIVKLCANMAKLSD